MEKKNTQKQVDSNNIRQINQLNSNKKIQNQKENKQEEEQSIIQIKKQEIQKNEEHQIKNNNLKQNSIQKDPIIQPQNLLTKQKLQIKQQLQSMQFDPQYVTQALIYTQTLDQAIQFIIMKLQSLDQKNIQQQVSNQVTLFFIVRMDLKMGIGKIAAQVGHASLKAFQNMRYSASNNDKSANLLIQWMQKGQKSKILQAQTEYQIHDYLQKASQKYINNCHIRDAGRTQIAAGSLTVGAIGPVQQSQVAFLNHLKKF